MTTKRQRLTLILVGLGLLGGAAGLALSALSSTVIYFRSPTELTAEAPAPDQRFRVGGLVKPDSVDRQADGSIAFVVTDGSTEIAVSFAGVLPDLFREGQGVVAEGFLAAPGRFTADTILAKHDETYMPPEVAEALREQGHWQGE
ncbi:MAG: cytochrome c maturation protein CcmE [Alphaproteobacteria bacterium]